jgi:hypothetical protein
MKNQLKIRNWLAVNAWHRSSSGPMKSNRYEDEDWERDWEEELKELEIEQEKNEQEQK